MLSRGIRFDGGLERDTLVKIGLALCLLNAALVLTLAGAGVLKTAQPGDITYVSETDTAEGPIVLPDDGRRFAVENPTDADIFYNIAVHVANGGALYPPETHDPKVWINAYVYAPPIFFFFAIFAVFGYIGFKIGWLLFSMAAVAFGTALVVRAEAKARGFDPPRRLVGGLAVAALGFQPLVANFKTAQSAPMMFLSVALLWWAFRRGRVALSGGSLVLGTLVKPYLVVPLVAITHDRDWRGVFGFAAVFVGAFVVSAVLFDVQTVLEYWQIMFDRLFSEAGGEPRTPAMWSPSEFNPFFILGGWAVLLRILFALPMAYVGIRYFWGRENEPLAVFTLSLATVMLFLKESNGLDMGIMLLAVLLLGFEYYDRDDHRLGIVVLALAMMQAHEYVLEILVGTGAEVIGVIGANQNVVIPLLVVLQPGTYAILALYGLSLELWAEHSSGALMARFRGLGYRAS
jgi:hypothetical protein